MDSEVINLINEFDVIQDDKVILDRLKEVFYSVDQEVPKEIKLKNYEVV